MLPKLLLPILALAALAPRAAGQQPLIPRPDTLGANFDDRTPGSAGPEDYDFLIGRWSYRFQFRDPATGAWGPVREGTWTATKRADAPFVADEFSGSAHGSESQGTTLTYRAFNPARKVWEIEGTALRRGGWQPGLSWSDGRDRFVVQDDPARGTHARIRYYSITPKHFLWRADGSRDGGRTWIRDIMLIEARRVE